MSHLAFIHQMHSALENAGYQPHEWEIRSLQGVGSTNTRVADMLGLYNKVIVISQTQSHGRGRNQNIWFSPRGGLWLSFGMLADVEVQELSSPVVKEVQAQLADLVECEIKPPNDILIDGKKVCGILVETKIKNNRLREIIVGIGINVKNEIPDEVSDIATTLQDHCNPPDIHQLGTKLIVRILRRFDKLMPQLWSSS